MILAVSVNEEESENKLKFSEEDSCELSLNSNVFIVDGQHRMMGMIKLFNELNEIIVKTDDDEFILQYLENYKFNCTILINYDLWEQGQVFVNVNFKQKPVNKSLYYEIFGSDYRESENDWYRNQIYQAHKITLDLNEHQDSPFYKHIKMLGTGNGYISQAFIVESLLPLFKRGGLWYLDSNTIKGDDNNYFSTELISYFVAIKNLFPEYWPDNDSSKGRIICKTTGFGAWIRLLGMMRDDDDTELLNSLRKSATKKEVCNEYVNNVENILNPLKKSAEILFGDDSIFKSASGRGSETNLYKKILFYLQNPQSGKDENLPFDSDKVCEKLQDYMWANKINDLDILCHHCEVENITQFKIKNYEQIKDVKKLKVSFLVYVNIYLDDEDDSSYSMTFPAEAEISLDKNKEYKLDDTNTTIRVDTDKYYQ